MATNRSPQLFEYGIQCDASDLRCHVAPVARAVYVFPTAVAKALATSGRYREVPAYQPGVAEPTAKGVPVPIADIVDLHTVRFAVVRWWEWFGATQFELNTSAKGQRAVDVVREIIYKGRFPMPPAATSTPHDQKTQIAGQDLLTWGGWKLQVKCDWWAGYRVDEDGQLVTDSSGRPYGTGNVFIQTHERNPLHLI